jgi:hypothetical protein
MPEGLVTITFVPSPRELWRARLWLTMHNPRQVIVYCSVPIVVGVVVAIGIGTITLGVLALILLYLALWWLALLIGSYVMYVRNKGARQARTMTFGDTGVTIKATDGEAKLNWEAFGSLRPKSGGHTIKMARERTFYWIPNRAFSSETDEAIFVMMATSHIGVRD